MLLADKSLRSKWTGSVIFRAKNVLPKSDQRKVLAVILIQVVMGGFDLLGIALIGVLGSLAVSGVESHQPGNRVAAVLKLLHIDKLQFQSQALVLGIMATTILISRTMISITFTRRILFFLSRRGALISSQLVSKFLAQSLLEIQKKTNQEFIYSVSNGVYAITLGIIGTAVSLISDTSLLFIMAAGLFVVDPTIAASTAGIFGLIGFAMYKLMHKKAQTLGRLEAKLNIESNEKVAEVLNSYRESVVRNRREYYSDQIGMLRLNLADTLAEVAFMPNVSKYVIETTVVIGALLISGIQFAIQDANHAVATLSIFLAAGTRIAPAVLRVQQGSIVIKGSLGASEPTLNLIDQLKYVQPLEKSSEQPEFEHVGFTSRVEINDLNFTYPGNDRPILTAINLEIGEGQSVAIVGSSGAGKTTLADIILGILEPISGNVAISGIKPSEAVIKWSGAVSYVPQDVMISNTSIGANVALGYSLERVSEENIWQALELAHMDEFVRSLPDGLNTSVGERGSQLSGGQRQRLGIARALFTKPKLLVLDEATSALDGQTEADITNSIQTLKGKVTTIIIAHRLSTVRSVDQVIYLAKGRIVAQGNFDQVRKTVPDFDQQAKLMGL
jgi:ABC-type multidrug transport system fused ATPase/permease subunit